MKTQIQIKTQLVGKGDGVWTKDQWKASYKTCFGYGSTEQLAIEGCLEAIREAKAFGEL